MTLSQTVQYLVEKDIITPEQADFFKKTTIPISIHWEIRILLLAGISFLCGGLGILVYKHIDTIGHQAIIGLIALAMLLCAGYVYRKRLPFLLHHAQKEQPLADNILLLGCSLFLILEGYLQYQYQIFGTRYGLATLIPTLLFLYCAYRFDHIGVLTMAMTAFVSWTGLTVTPLSIVVLMDSIFKEDVFNHEPTLIHTGMASGFILIIIGFLLNFRKIKPHFTFSYLNFGFNLVCVATLYGAFQVQKVPYSMLCLAMGILAIVYARIEKSYFFLLAGVIYAYIAFTILISELDFSYYGWLLYGVLSCFSIVVFFLQYKKIINE